MKRVLALVVAVGVSACATAPQPRPYLTTLDTAAQATGCPAEELLVVQDDEGWMAAGCGQLASGSAASKVEHSEPMTCAALATFDTRLRVHLSKKTGTALSAPVKGVCRERTVAMSNGR